MHLQLFASISPGSKYSQLSLFADSSAHWESIEAPRLILAMLSQSFTDAHTDGWEVWASGHRYSPGWGRPPGGCDTSWSVSGTGNGALLSPPCLCLPCTASCPQAAALRQQCDVETLWVVSMNTPCQGLSISSPAGRQLQGSTGPQTPKTSLLPKSPCVLNLPPAHLERPAFLFSVVPSIFEAGSRAHPGCSQGREPHQGWHSAFLSGCHPIIKCPFHKVMFLVPCFSF